MATPAARPGYRGGSYKARSAQSRALLYALIFVVTLWLIGPFIEAWLKVHPDDRKGARRYLEGFVNHLHEACIGSISEVFDAEEPFTPRGCVAQAWSVAEVLRCWVKTAPEVSRPNKTRELAAAHA